MPTQLFAFSGRTEAGSPARDVCRLTALHLCLAPAPRFDWFLWTFQVVWLMIVGLCWYRRTLRKYQVGALRCAVLCCAACM